MLRKKFFQVFFLILALSFVYHSDTAQATSNEDIEEVKKVIVTAYKSFKKEVDVSEYNLIHSGDKDTTAQIMTEVMTQTPGLFYSGLGYEKNYNGDTGHIRSLVLSYDKAYLKKDGSVNVTKIKNTQKKIDGAVNTALKSVNSNMGKLDKALVLHDYLIKNISYYNNTSANYRMTEEGAFLNKKANCQGYALAYAILMEKIGVPVKFVSSEGMGHIWNMIQIGGKWYHVDVTWDDPVEVTGKKDQYGLVRHDYFMCSTNKMKKEGYSGFKAPVSVAGTKYDNAWWKSVSSEIFYKGGKWLYINNKGIVSKSGLTSGSAKVLRKLNGKSMVKFNSNRYYLITQNSVYLYIYSNNSLKKVWSPKKKYGASSYVTQIKYQNGRVYYRVLNYSGTKYQNGSFKVKKTNGLAA